MMFWGTVIYEDCSSKDTFFFSFSLCEANDVSEYARTGTRVGQATM